MCYLEASFHAFSVKHLHFLMDNLHTIRNSVLTLIGPVIFTSLVLDSLILKIHARQEKAEQSCDS